MPPSYLSRRPRIPVAGIVVVSLFAALTPAAAQTTGCPPYSPLPCAEIGRALPFALTFDGTEGGLLDDATGGAVGTGFTMVQPRSAGDPYIPQNLRVEGGELTIATTTGIRYRVPGRASGDPVTSLDNGLGVGLDPGTQALRLETTLLAPPAGTGRGERAGIWFGPNEEDHVELAVVSAGSGNVEIQLRVGEGRENTGDPALAVPALNTASFAPGSSTIRLILVVDPVVGSAVGSYRIDGGAERSVPGPIPLREDFSDDPVIASDIPGVTTAAGLFASHSTGTSPLQYRFGEYSISTQDDGTAPAPSALDGTDGVTAAADGSSNESLGSSTVGALSADAQGTVLVNFQSPDAPVPSGYVRDFGEPYGARTLANQGSGLEYGWVEPGTSTPRDLSIGGTVPGNGRDRNLVSDQRYDTLMHMQADDIAGTFNGTKLPGSWEIAVPNGTYTVTVAAGDPNVGADPESHQLNVEGNTAIDRFVPTGLKGSATRSATATVSVRVQDGRLTIDALGGANTKIHFADVVADAAAAARPAVTGVSPSNGATAVNRDDGVAATVSLPNVGQGVDPTTMTNATVQLVRASDGTQVPARLNTSGGGDIIVLQPVAPLEATTRYTFRVTQGLKDTSGAAFLPFMSHFVTGTEGGGGGGGAVAFEKVSLPTAEGRSFTSVEIGPDGRLYAGTITGEIARFPINTDGTLGTPQIITSLKGANGGNDRMLIGLAFDPASTPSAPILWVTHTAFAFTNGPDWTGKLTRLSGTDLGTVQDYVIHLPRSIRDHVTNSLTFGPDGAIYFLQGSNTAMGAADTAWGNRPEHVLNAAVLRFRPTAVSSPPLDAKTEDGGTYDPWAAGAPLTVYSSGIRNAYDLLWHSNGSLYVPTNGSAAGGNTPGTPTPLPSSCTKRIDRSTNGSYTGPEVPGLTNVTTTQSDYLFRVQATGYYGHPNPARCEWVMNGGNPTSSSDPAQVGQYPVGTMPDRNWRGFAFDFGKNKSPNGVIEYQSDAFGGALKGKLLVARYSQGDDIIVLTPGAGAGDIVDSDIGLTGLTGFADPLDLIEDPSTGRLYVTEFGANKITLLRPLTTGGGQSDIATSPARLVFNDVQGGAASAPATVTIENQGSADLTVTGISITGPNAGQFKVVSAPTLPATIPAGGSVGVQVAFAPSSTGPKGAFLQVTSDDADEPQVTTTLRGLGTLGTGGSNEPSLQWILDTYQIPVNVGDPDPTNSSLPTDPLLGDEVALQRFVKAGAGPVTIEPLAVFGPDAANPVLRFGWYLSGNGATKNELFTVSNDPASNAQTLNVPVTGTTQFDPGTATFSIYSIWPFFSNRAIYGEDALNTFSGAIPHHVRVYPLENATGQPVPNAYVIATEENTSGFDYQDVVVEIHNVAPAPTIGGDAEISVRNLDGVPYDDRLAFNRIGSLSTPPSNGVHNVAKLRVGSDGSDALTISGLTVSGPWQIDGAPSMPVTIPAGGHLDLTVRFVAATGDVHLGSLSIASNDADQRTTVVQLGGFWQSVSEGGQEPRLAETMQVFGYGTQITRLGQPLNQQGLVTAVGDEVLSPYWRRADTTIPVSVRQIGAFHTQGATATLRWHPKGSTTLSAIFTSAGIDGQSYLPRKNNQLDQPAAGSFTPTSAVFGFKVDGEWSDPTKNNQTVDQSNGCPGPCGHHVRFWPVRDRTGTLVANTWLMSMDYAGINYDYNDNTYLISNIKPEVSSSDPSRQALLPGAQGLVLEFDGTKPNTLVDKDGQFTGFTSAQRNRIDTTTSVNSYQSSLLDVSPAVSRLAIITTAGSNIGSDNTQVNGLQVGYDSTLEPSTVHGRLIGPFDQFNAGQRQGGVMFGSDQDNYVKLVAINKSGLPKIELLSEVGGSSASVTTLNIPSPATLQTLDLYLVPDPQTRRIRAAYRAVGPSTDSGLQFLPVDVTIPSASVGRFFMHHGYAGILTSHKGATQFTVTFDRFSVSAGAIGAGPDPRQALHRLDVAASGPYTDTKGNRWIPDTGLFSPSTAIDEGATVQPQEIANTDDDVIYRTYRGNVGSVPLSQRILTYEIPTFGLTDMDLRLHFAERASGNDLPGERLFDVIAEGRKVLREFDIVAASGGQHTAIVAPIRDVTVRDGYLTLTFRTVVDYASIAGIEVLCPGTCPPRDTTPPASPTGLTASVSGSDVKLDWDTQQGSDIGGYHVYRSSSAAGPFTRLTPSILTVSRYTDVAVGEGTWVYHVTTVDTAGNESPPAQISATVGQGVDTFTGVSWSSVAPNPLGRHEAFGAVVDGELYLFGGYFGDPNFTPTTRADVYDPATNTWTQIASLPKAVSHAGATAVGTNIYYAGGYPIQTDGTGQTFCTTAVWKYDTLTDTYSAMPPLPAGRGGGALVEINGFLHFFGGSNCSRSDATTNHWRLDLNGGTQWTTRAAMPVPRNHLGGVTLGGKIYAVAGQSGQDQSAVYRADVHAYDPTTNAWTAVASLPFGISHNNASTVTMGGRIIVLGGENGFGSPIDDVRAYTPSTNRWVDLTSLPANRAAAVAGAIDGILYLATGHTTRGTFKGVPQL